MFDGLKDMGKLLKQAKEMKSKMKEVQEQLKKVRVSATAANDKIKIVVTGELEVVELSIDPTLLEPKNASNLEKSLLRAFNEATNKAKALATQKLSEVSGGLDIPGLN